MTQGVDVDMESLEAFGERARAWIEQNLPNEGDETLTDHELQQQIFDAGYAGIAFPKEYGGAGLTLQHQKVFFDTAGEIGRRVPAGYMVSIGMMAATLLDHGSELLKQRHLPRMLRGDEEWMQLLSEPSGGSDMAGALTRLDARRRQLHPQRLEDVELGRGAGRLRPVPGAHRLGRAEAPGALHDRGAAEGHARPHHRPDPRRSRASTATSAPSSSTTSSSRPRTSWARRTRAGRWRSGCCTTSGSPPPGAGHGYGLGAAGAAEVGFGGRGVRRAHRRRANATP